MWTRAMPRRWTANAAAGGAAFLLCHCRWHVVCSSYVVRADVVGALITLCAVWKVVYGAGLISFSEVVNLPDLPLFTTV